MAYDVEICVPIADGISGDCEVYGRELEGGAMAASVHNGRTKRLLLRITR